MVGVMTLFGSGPNETSEAARAVLAKQVYTIVNRISYCELLHERLIVVSKCEAMGRGY